MSAADAPFVRSARIQLWFAVTLLIACKSPTTPADMNPDAATLTCGQSSPWRVENSNTSLLLTAIWGSGPGDVYLVGSNVLAHSSGTGVWTSLTADPKPAAFNYQTVWGSGPNDVYVGGDSVWHSTDGGKSWIAPRWPVATVWGLSATDLFGFTADAVAVNSTGGALYHSADGGSTWTLSLTGNAGAVWGTSAADLYCATHDGTLHHSSDDGASWQTVTGGPPCLAFAGAAGNVLCVAADDVYRSIDNGNSWTALAATVGITTPRLRAIWASADAGDLYAVGSASANNGAGTTAVVIHSADGGVTWAREDNCGATNLQAVWASSPNDVYVANDFVFVLHHSN